MIISQSKNNFPLLIISYPSVQLTKSKHQISTLKSQVTKTQMTKDHLGTIINNKSINYFASIIYANTLVPSHNNPKKNVIVSSSAFMVHPSCIVAIVSYKITMYSLLLVVYLLIQFVIQPPPISQCKHL